MKFSALRVTAVSNMSKGGESIKVVIRCRPLNGREKEDGRLKIVDMDRQSGQVVLNNPKGDNSEPPKSFTFDSVMDENITQREVYELSARPIVANVIEGYNGTVFAYGCVLPKLHVLNRQMCAENLFGLQANWHGQDPYHGEAHVEVAGNYECDQSMGHLNWQAGYDCDTTTCTP